MRFGSSYSDSTDDPSFEILKVATQNLNWKVDFFDCPSWKRCLLLMESGDIDMMPGLFKTSEREKYMYYVEPPYFGERIAFYFRKGQGSDVKEHKNLKGLTIGVRIGVKHVEPFDSDTSLDKFEVPIANQMYKMLQAGRIDTFIGNEAQDALLKDSEFKDQFEKAPYQLPSGDDYFTISKKSPYAKDRFKFGKVLKQFIDSGKVKEIYKKFGHDWRPPTQQAPK